MGKTQLIKDGEVFQWISELGDTLELFGELLNWTDTHESGLAEHRILQRSGALHQDVGAPPKKFEFHCVLQGKNVNARYKRMVATFDASPFGQIIHPRLGIKQAAQKTLSSQEDPSQEIDTIRYTISFVEDGLRKVPTESPGALASGAAEKVAALLASSPMALQPAAMTLSAKVTSFQTSASAQNPSPLDLQHALDDVKKSTAAYEKLVDTRGESYYLKAQARLVQLGCIQSYNAVLAGRPPIIERTVRATMSLPHLCAALYGGRHAKEQMAEIYRLNRIPRPWAIAPGTRLLLPDPDKVKALPPSI